MTTGVLASGPVTVAQPLFGIEPTILSDYSVEWVVGPMRACARAYAFDRRPDLWVGVWQLNEPRRPELSRTKTGDLEQVARALESWLRLHLALTVGALGLELRERGS